MSNAVMPFVGPIEVDQVSLEAAVFPGAVNDAGEHPDGADDFRFRREVPPDRSADEKACSGRPEVGERAGCSSARVRRG